MVMKKGSVVSDLPDYLIAYSYSLAPLVILSQTSTSSFLSAHGNPFQDSISSSSAYGLLGYIRSIKIRVRNLRTNLHSPWVERNTVESAAGRTCHVVLTNFQARQPAGRTRATNPLPEIGTEPYHRWPWKSNQRFGNQGVRFRQTR